MPKRLQQKRNPRRALNHGTRQVEVGIAERELTAREPTDEEVSKVMAALGRRGGKIGGKRRLETMTQQERSAIAFKAAQARWKNAKRGKR